MNKVRFPLLRLLLTVLCVACCPVEIANAGQNVVVVLDDSGSMDDRMRKAGRRVRKIAAAKEALATVLEQLPEDAQVGVVLLNGRINRQPWLVELGPVDIGKTKAAIANVRAKGGTPLGQFMKVAGDALLAMRDDERYGDFRLLIVTDGEAGDEHLVERFLPDIMARGITVDVIGVDMESEHSLATKVHSYRRADNPDSLTQAIREVFAETSQDSGDAGESDFELLEGLPMECASAALVALTETSNIPIGERALGNSDDGANGILGRVNPPGNQSGQGNQAGPGNRGGGAQPNAGKPFSLSKVFMLFIFFFALSNIFRAVFRSKRHG